LRTVLHFASSTIESGSPPFQPFDPGLETNRDFHLGVSFAPASASFEYILSNTEHENLRITEEFRSNRDSRIKQEGRLWADRSFFHTLVRNDRISSETRRIAERMLRGARLFRLDPDSLRIPSELIPESELIDFAGERGEHLPGVYDAIVNRDVESFTEIKKGVRSLFPTVKNVSLRNETKSTKAIEIELTNGTRVPAQFISDGLLHYLAFAAIPYLRPTQLILIEEPENGLHPARIAEVMRILREVSKTTQVVLATHSPLVINELNGYEVSVVTRTDEEGTSVTLLKDIPYFEQGSRIYALGELWVSYCNGVDEGPLLKGGPRE
jgi:predicted ATPase